MQNKSTWVLIIALCFAFASVASAADHQFIGATKCKMCHNTAAKGEIYTKWSATAHSKAFATLASEAAKKVATEKGIADPQKADACLKCHVTGYNAKAEMKGAKYSAEEGVTCESCHGAGGDYEKNATMKGLTDGTIKPETVGFVTPDEKTCVGCHNAESPTFKGFKFAEMWPKIEHKVPKK
jgi:hypothetical protein